MREGGIEFRDVSFEYPDDHNQVLRHVNLRIRPGESLALVGPSGGGKTTLCNLIPRFYDVTGGEILIDGQNVRDVTLRSLRDAIGVVQQGRLPVQRYRSRKHRLRQARRFPGRKSNRPPNWAGADAFVRALKEWI